MHTYMGEDRCRRTHMITFDFDLNGTIIKWSCVRNKILKSTCTIVKLQFLPPVEEKKKLQHLLETHGIFSSGLLANKLTSENSFICQRSTRKN
jgi:hypothetical protein